MTVVDDIIIWSHKINVLRDTYLLSYRITHMFTEKFLSKTFDKNIFTEDRLNRFTCHVARLSVLRVIVSYRNNRRLTKLGLIVLFPSSIS